MPAASSLLKNCPQCHAALTADAGRCDCGHSFDTETTAVEPSSDLVIQAEALYESHLRARLRRATRAARLAQVDLLRDPRNAAKAAQLREAQKEARIIETQLELQTARVADARANSRRPPTPLVSAQSTIAPETFRAVQALKADSTFELLRLQLAVERLRTGEVPAAFQTAQAEKARGIGQRASTEQTCPGCRASVSVSAARCNCGYVFTAAGKGTAAEFLTAEELTALRRSNT